MNTGLSLAIDIFVIIEIIIAEFISIYYLSRKKHKFIYCLLSYAIVTAIIVVLMIFVLSKFDSYGNGAGGNMLIGVVFLIPIFINYGGSIKEKLFVSFFSFSYAILIFAVSVRIAYIFENFYLNLTTFVIETILFCLTMPFFIKYAKGKIMPSYDSASKKNQILICFFTILIFVVITQLNKAFTEEPSNLVKALVYIAFGLSLIIVFAIIGLFLKSEGDLTKLNISVQEDTLTKLGNRLAFKIKSEALQASETPFYLVFLDLDKFKNINDKYGHVVGDTYLKLFADRLKELANENTSFYRMSGDEFVCISTKEEDCQSLINIKIEKLGECPFLGFSFGLVKYPEETGLLSELIELADNRMYVQKKKKF